MSTNSIIQLGLFDNKHPECLNVANKWHFPLTPFNHNNQHIYSVLEWVAGMNGYTTEDRNARVAVSRIKQSLSFSKNQHFVNGDSDNPEDIMATAQGLYLIAQNMRSRKSTPQIQAIKDYLAAAGVFADTARQVNAVYSLPDGCASYLDVPIGGQFTLVSPESGQASVFEVIWHQVPKVDRKACRYYRSVKG